jgi:hypothetical protein
MSIVVETVNDEDVENVDLGRMECRGTQISCMAAKSLAKLPKACRPQEGLKAKAPKQPEMLGRAIKRTAHREAFIPDVKSWVSRENWQGYKRTPTSGSSHIQGAQLGW